MEIYCPQYENISVNGMLQEAKQDPDLMSYLPDEKELHLLPRQWLANVIYTRLGQLFKDWVDRHVKARHEKYTSKHNLLIDMDPEVAAAFNTSAQVSSIYFSCSHCVLYCTATNGKGVHILKVGSKRRRTATQLEELKE